MKYSWLLILGHKNPRAIKEVQLFSKRHEAISEGMTQSVSGDKFYVYKVPMNDRSLFTVEYIAKEKVK